MHLKCFKWAVAGITAIVIATLAPGAFAQRVNFAGTEFTLGAPKAQTLAQARAQFNLLASQNPGEYFMYSKAIPLDQNGRPAVHHALGSITFKGGRLARITRNLGSFRSRNGTAAIQRLIKALAGAPNRGKQPAVHTDAHMSSGEASTTRVYFSYPDRVIQVAVFQPVNRSTKATVDITEQYALPSN